MSKTLHMRRDEIEAYEMMLMMCRNGETLVVETQHQKECFEDVKSSFCPWRDLKIEVYQFAEIADTELNTELNMEED